MAFGAVTDVLRVGGVVRLRHPLIRAPRQRQLLAHVDLVDEDREVEHRLSVQDRRGAGPGPVAGDGWLREGVARAVEASLVVVAGDAGANVVAYAIVEFARTKLARPIWDSAVGGV